jgi:hypothetical protein
LPNAIVTGYRVIYQVQSSVAVLLLLLYSKSDQEDVTAEEIRDVIDESSLI